MLSTAAVISLETTQGNAAAVESMPPSCDTPLQTP